MLNLIAILLAASLDDQAAALRAQHRLDAAEAIVRKVLERDPGDPDAYRNLADIEADRGRIRLAESALNNARRLDPKDAGILNDLGLLAMRRKDVTAARAAFEEATRLDPSFAPAWANLGALALAFRDYATAEAASAKAAELDASRWETHLTHAWALEGLHRPKEARAAFEQVLALAPDQDDALFGRANALKAEGDLRGALAAFKAYAERPGAARATDARTQLSALDVRLQAAAKIDPVQ